MKTSEDTSRIRKALFAVGGAVLFLLAVAGVARCSSPSTLQTGSVDSGTDAINAAAVGVEAVRAWAGSDASLAGLRWLDADTAVVTARLAGGEHVAATAVYSDTGWEVPFPPSPAPSPGGPSWGTLSSEKLAAATGDDRWAVAEGFLAAWLTGEPTERWTATAFTAPPPSVVYSSWEAVGVAGPTAVPGTAIEVIAVEFKAAVEDGTERRYRTFVAVAVDAAGRWTVNAVANRPPAAE